jgi:hypothetical protein
MMEALFLPVIYIIYIVLVTITKEKLAEVKKV